MAKHCDHPPEDCEARVRSGVHEAWVQAQCRCGKGVGSSIKASLFPPTARQALRRWEPSSSPTKRKRDYQARFKAPDWKSKRYMCADAANFQCERCGEPTILEDAEIHHLSYRGFESRDERPSELQYCCRPCHRAISRKFA